MRLSKKIQQLLLYYLHFHQNRIPASGIINSWIFRLFLLIATIAVLFAYHSKENKPDEITLRRYAVSYVFYHYGINELLLQPVRIVGDNFFVKFDTLSSIKIALNDFNYLKLKYYPIKKEKQLLIFDIMKENANGNDSTLSLIGKEKAYLHTGKIDSGFINAANFYNNLFEDKHISYDELIRELKRKPYFFSSLDEAYQVILDALPLIKKCEGGAHIIDGGVWMCPGATLSRKLYFNKLVTVKITDLAKEFNHPDTTIQNNIFLLIGRQIGEKYNGVSDGDSTFWIPLYQINRKYIDKAYQLEDALIYMATY